MQEICSPVLILSFLLMKAAAWRKNVVGRELIKCNRYACTFLYYSYKVRQGNIVCFRVTDSDLGQAKVSHDKLNNIQHILKITLYKITIL